MNELFAFYMRSPVKRMTDRSFEILLTEADFESTMTFIEVFFDRFLNHRKVTESEVDDVVHHDLWRATSSTFGDRPRSLRLVSTSRNSYALFRSLPTEQTLEEKAGVIRDAANRGVPVTVLYRTRNSRVYTGIPRRFRSDGFQLQHSGGYRNLRYERIVAGYSGARPNPLPLVNGIPSDPVLTLRFDTEYAGYALLRMNRAAPAKPDNVREWSRSSVTSLTNWVPLGGQQKDLYIHGSRSLWGRA